LFRPRIKFSFQPIYSLTGKTEFASPLPQFLRFDNPGRRDDAGDQFRRRHVKTRIARTARRIRHTDVGTLVQF